MYHYSADFDFDDLHKSLEKFSDYFQKKIFLINERFDFLLFRLAHPDSVNNNYLKCLCLEEKRLDLTEEIERKREETIAKNEALNSFQNDKTITGNPEIVLTEESMLTAVSSRIAAMDSRGMKYFFRNNGDQEIFFKSVADYFISGKCTPPNLVLQKHCKVKLCIALNSIYRHYRPKTPLNEYSGFIKLLKKLSIFENQSNYQIYKAIIRQNG